LFLYCGLHDFDGIVDSPERPIPVMIGEAVLPVWQGTGIRSISAGIEPGVFR
jgi:hypothetical protein